MLVPNSSSGRGNAHPPAFSCHGRDSVGKVLPYSHPLTLKLQRAKYSHTPILSYLLYRLRLHVPVPAFKIFCVDDLAHGLVLQFAFKPGDDIEISE